ncbi:hypothetical protein G6F26_012078 [Rhizopus arrhizus]|nr:hypothetical protein G6F30_012883 [Rhizopus arrhizus]KAG1394616.1 hypothetical protein G6F58_012100 [Rhizopus delemar]KAG0978444.1 hypothetical protein G6F28_012140 [Rhizopus arrhizus]KAG1001425.1 hypothetical protein G6F27_012887 [Rhizopus arrhizus]KAG1017002.1 hypothetical protein G6F26_012078 [Rhizopus arrhizus]
MVDNPFIPRNANQALIYQNDHLHHQHRLPNNHNIDLVDSNEHTMPALALNQVHYNNTLGTNQLVTMDTSRNRNHSRHVQVNGYYNNSADQQHPQGYKNNSSLVQDAYDEILEAGTSHNENNSNCEEQQPEPKKRKYLKAADFKNVGWGNKVTMLNEHFGTNGVLDLTRTSIIPKRLRTVVDGICQHYHLSLPMTLKNEEYMQPTSSISTHIRNQKCSSRRIKSKEKTTLRMEVTKKFFQEGSKTMGLIKYRFIRNKSKLKFKSILESESSPQAEAINAWRQ